MKHCVCMRKNNKMVSLNPEYGIEVTTLNTLAEKVKDYNPELYSILVTLVASVVAKDEKQLVAYTNSYLEEKVYTDKIKKSINKMLDDQSNKLDDFDFNF